METENFKIMEIEPLAKVFVRHSRGLPSNFVIGGGYDGKSVLSETFARASINIII